MTDRRQVVLSLAALSLAGCARASAPSASGIADPLPPMLSPRATHAAVAIGGGALMIGGFAEEGRGIAMIERFDAARRRFDRFATLSVGRIQPIAILLDSGDTLVIGGEWDAPVSTAELIGATGGTVALGATNDRRTAAAAVKLRDGRVLVTGGSRPGYGMTASAELYDPLTQRFVLIASMREPRAGHSATLLSDGTVLLTGGGEGGAIVASTEIFDPRREAFAAAPPMRQARYKHGAALTRDGALLVIGGSDDRSGPDGRGRLKACERYDPASSAFATAPSLEQARYKLQNAAVSMPNGDIIVASGYATAEILRTGSPRFETFATFDTRRDFMTATPIGARSVLVAGGYDGSITGSATAWLLTA